MRTLRWWIATVLFKLANRLPKLEVKLNNLGLNIGWGWNRHE
jgi:hypothetical protein